MNSVIIIAVIFNLVSNIFLLSVIHSLTKREDMVNKNIESIADILKTHSECIRIIGETTFKTEGKENE